MPVSTRSMRARWPSIDASSSVVVGNPELTLPSDLYWDYVRPYTPIEDRPILNKRTGSTQFYAGDREEIDSAFLKKYERELGFTGPRATGEPGSDDFCMRFDDSGGAKFSSLNEEAALEYLRDARKKWDEHLSKLKSPSLRLEECLRVFDSDDHPDFPVLIPLLFPGKGGVEDVCNFHASMNLMSINGPPSHINTFPNTQLGYWMSEFLNDVDGNSTFTKDDRKSKTKRTEKIVEWLLRAGTNVDIFFQPLNGYPRGSFTPLSFFDSARCIRPGESIVDCMRAFACVSIHDELEEQDQLLPMAISRLVEWLEISKLDNHLRFEVGDRVECMTGQDEWEVGTVTEEWYFHYAYQVKLDVDDFYQRVLVDSDDLIRAAA